MRPMCSLIQREFAAYFLSFIGYLTMAIFLGITGAFFKVTFDLLTTPGTAGVEYPMQSMLGSDGFWLIFMIFPPMLTMRLFAEERGTGTLELLMTAPIRDWQVVAGKYIACLLFYAVLWLPTLLYLPVLLDMNWDTGHTRIDPWPAVTSYVGVFLVGAMFLAIGLFVSSLVKSQVVAAMLTFVFCIGFVVVTYARKYFDPSSLWAQVIQFVSVPDHFRRDFTRGVIDTRAVVLYVTVTLFSLFLTVRSLEARRLR